MKIKVVIIMLLLLLLLFRPLKFPRLVELLKDSDLLNRLALAPPLPRPKAFTMRMLFAQTGTRELDE